MFSDKAFHRKRSADLYILLYDFTFAASLGTMFAGIAVTETFCSLSGSVLASTIYANTVDVFRGTIFLVDAGNVFISSILTV